MEAAFDLKSIRKEKGMKQEELASTVGVSPQAVSKWEQGGMPDATLLPAIADALGVTMKRRKRRDLYGHTALCGHIG